LSDGIFIRATLPAKGVGVGVGVSEGSGVEVGVLVSGVLSNSWALAGLSSPPDETNPAIKMAAPARKVSKAEAHNSFISR